MAEALVVCGWFPARTNVAQDGRVQRQLQGLVFQCTQLLPLCHHETKNPLHRHHSHVQNSGFVTTVISLLQQKVSFGGRIEGHKSCVLHHYSTFFFFFSKTEAAELPPDRDFVSKRES